VVATDALRQGKVGIVTGGGSGHEPAFVGYVGRGMCDAVAVGELFSSPTANSFLDAIKAADGGVGVVVLYGNYAGDNINVKMAARMAAKAGIEVLTVVANDDVSSAPATEREKRRGVAGEILMWKIGGAAAARGDGAMAEIGGSMGPLYGMMFSDMADAIRGHDTIDASTFRTMLTAGADGVAAIGDARPGDKTMLDALLPAVAAFGDGNDFADRLDRMMAAADAGRDATVDMVARVGRAARLGERSRGVPDAGATSCALILRALARGTLARLTPGGG
jgi:dihydroxyacetone kinase